MINIPPREPQQEMANENLGNGVVARKEKHAENAEAHGTDGHQAQFHLVAGKFARHKCAQPDADRYRSGKVADSGVAQMQKVAAVADHILQIDRAQKPEIGDGQNRSEERARAANFREVMPELAEGVPCGISLRRRWRERG